MHKTLSNPHSRTKQNNFRLCTATLLTPTTLITTAGCTGSDANVSSKPDWRHKLEKLIFNYNFHPFFLIFFLPESSLRQNRPSKLRSSRSVRPCTDYYDPSVRCASKIRPWRTQQRSPDLFPRRKHQASQGYHDSLSDGHADQAKRRRHRCHRVEDKFQ